MNLSCTFSAFTPTLVSAPGIFLLEHKPEFFLEVAQRHHQECERQGLKSSLVLRQQRLIMHIKKGAVPKTLIAVQGNELVGCVSLVNNELHLVESTPHSLIEKPVWLSNLFVIEQYRYRGIGTALVDAAKQYAQHLDVSELWLSATDCTDYYQKRGWTVVRSTRLAEQQVNVMWAPLG